jgi:hypothetical protein
VPTFKKKKPEVTFQWHPNFRVVKTLPDIKAVRTDFVVNFAAATVAVLTLGWMLYIESGIFQADRQMTLSQTQIDEHQKTNTTYLQLSGQFVHDSKGLQELTKFYGQNISPMQLLATLTAARPDNILFDSIAVLPTEIEGKTRAKLKTQEIVLDGTLTGEAEDLKGLDGLVQTIMASPMLKPRISDPANARRIDNRREGPGVFKFTITITLQPAV